VPQLSDEFRKEFGFTLLPDEQVQLPDVHQLLGSYTTVTSYLTAILVRLNLKPILFAGFFLFFVYITLKTVHGFNRLPFSKP
jgi:hypothetical protein